MNLLPQRARSSLRLRLLLATVALVAVALLVAAVAFERVARGVVMEAVHSHLRSRAQEVQDSVERFHRYQWPFRRAKRPRSPSMVMAHVPPGPTKTASISCMPPGATRRNQCQSSSRRRPRASAIGSRPGRPNSPWRRDLELG